MGTFRYIGLAALQARGMAAVTAATVESAEHLVGEAQAAAPKKTGTLAASIHTTDLQVGVNTVSVKVATGGEASDYAIAQHEGAAPHEIRPKDKQALAGPGLPYPVAVVHHPGNPPTKYIEGPAIAHRPVHREAMRRAASGQF